MQPMPNPVSIASRHLFLLCGLLLLLYGSRLSAEEPTPVALAAFQRYTRSVEARLIQQHRSAASFLAAAGPDPTAAEANLHRGELIIEHLSPGESENLSGAMLHHWRGTAFAPGAKPADFERLMREVNAYPQHFAPEVEQARLLAQNGDRLQSWMRVRQHHVITVVMDTSYDVTFGRLDPSHGYSLAQSTRIAEVGSPGTPAEHALAPTDEHGFLWRLNTYWSYEQRDGGLYLQIEAVSLTRAVPRGLGWAVGPYVESIPRESLEFTLRSACNAIRH